MMRVRDWMTQPVVAVRPSTSLLEARRLLRRHGIRHLPVVSEAGVVGMLSDRDLVLRDTAVIEGLCAVGSDLARGRERSVAEVMSAPANSIGPDEDVRLAAARMVAGRIGALPVVERRRLVGIISLVDVVTALRGEPPARSQPREDLVDLDCPPPPMPAGDERPGRPAVRVAEVVDPDPARRSARAAALRDEGYLVITCPGPLAGTRCSAVGPGEPAACSRFPGGVERICLDAETAATGLAQVYARWAPSAELVIECRRDAGRVSTA